jgi:hypothetical protein
MPQHCRSPPLPPPPPPPPFFYSAWLFQITLVIAHSCVQLQRASLQAA